MVGKRTNCIVNNTERLFFLLLGFYGEIQIIFGTVWLSTDLSGVNWLAKSRFFLLII